MADAVHIFNQADTTAILGALDIVFGECDR
jgi:NADH:ubiquinone oxidoreductase subunit D